MPKPKRAAPQPCPTCGDSISPGFIWVRVTVPGFIHVNRKMHCATCGGTGKAKEKADHG